MNVVDAVADSQKPDRRKAGHQLKHSYWKRFMSKESSHDTFARSGDGKRTAERLLSNLSGFNPDKRAAQLVPAITNFDGLDGAIFPLRAGFAAPTKIHLTMHADGGSADCLG
jgi:hypothetical protein